MDDFIEIEEKNRKRLIDLAAQIPKGVPSGWKCDILAVGGLMYVGFSEIHTEKLICVSSQGQSVIDCKTLKKTYYDENFDENELTAYAEELGEEQIKIAGEGGGGLRLYSNDGNILEEIAPFWPKKQIVFMPKFHSWYHTPKECRIVFDGYEIKAYGFSKCGRYYVIATSSELIIFRKISEQ